MNKTVLFFLVVLIFSALLVFHTKKDERNTSENFNTNKSTSIISGRKNKEAEQNKIVLSGPPRSAEIYDISEYDFKTKEYIYNLRESVVARTMGDFVKDYKVNDKVYGAIEDHRPWWGMDGIMCKGSGQHSIDGPSEESRYINNPLILVGLDTNAAMKIPNWECRSVYPKPRKIMINPDLNKITVTYDLTNYNRKIEGTYWANMNNVYRFTGQNALDFGYDYGFVSNYGGIRFNQTPNISTHVYKFLDFLHRGGSCGFEGGCNNGSPNQPDLQFSINSLPANADFKLFRHMPKSDGDTPDLLFQLIFE